VSQPPPPRDGPPRRDAWAAYDELTRRLLALEEIAERLAATSVDPIAVDDWRAWKAGGPG
jgi:hypothetical protein